MSTAIANQLFLVYLGRPADTAWRTSTAELLNGNQPSVALQTAFYNASISEGVFSATDSSSMLVNKIFLQTFGFAASTFEQTAWGNLVTNGTITKETLAWTIFKSYLGATNVPDTYKIPAQSKLIAIDAYTNQLMNDGSANLALSMGGGAATLARSYAAGVTTQASAAAAVSGVAASVASLASAQTGSTFTLTTGADNFTGTGLNDTFNASEGLNAAPTMTVSDSLDGGAGIDTLNIVTTAAITGVPVGVTVKNVEIVNATSANGVAINTVTGGGGFSGLTTLNTTSVASLAATAAATTDVTATVSGAGATNDGIDIQGGKNITLAVSATVDAPIDADAEIVVGSTTAAAGTVTITSRLVGADTYHAGDISVKGGTSVTVTQSLGNAVNTTNTQGYVSVTGTAATKTVTVTQDAAATATATVVGKVNGDVSVLDANRTSATVAGSIETVTLNSFGAATVNSGALKTLNLSGTGTSVDAHVLGALTTVTNTALALNLNGLKTTGLVEIDTDIVTLNVAGSMAASTIATLTANGAKTVNISGDASVTFTADNLTALETVTVTNTAGASFGTAIGTGVTFTGGAGADTVTLTSGFTKTITMGAGNDTVTYAGAAGTGGSVAAGDGTDTIVMTGAQAATASGSATFNNTFSGFEVLKLSALAADTINLAGINNVNSVSAGGSTGAGVINGFTSGGTLTLTADAAGGDYTVGVTNANLSSTDVFNIILSKSTGVLAAGVVNVANVETINISTADAASGGSAAVIHTLTLTDATDKSIIVTGNNGLTLTTTSDVATNLFDASGVVANGTADTTANLRVTYTSAYTGSGTATIIGGAGDDVLTGDASTDTMNGGGGADRLDGAAGNDTISGDAGNDTIIGGAGQDVLTGGAGVEYFDYLNGSSVSATGANVDKITDFVAGTDKIALQLDGGLGHILAGVTLTANTAAVATLGTAIAAGATVSSIADVYTALGVVLDAAALGHTDASGTAVVARVVTFANGSSAGSYLVVNDGADGFQGATDIVINITGITGTLAATDFSFFA